jgi:phosphoribosyl 1,2-cyclic phosphodiesterase
MRIKVWGCRGSLTTPGPGSLRYGGHTTCLEVRTADGELIIVDAGSGMRDLGMALQKEKDLDRITLLFTHAHWDHLNGFPFFAPAYSPRFQITLCGGAVAQGSIRNYLTQQMRPPFFPVDFAHLKARFRFGCQCGHGQCPGQMTGINRRFQCQSLPLNHPNGGYGFKFVENGKSFIFLTDNELGFEHPGGLRREEYVRRCAGADLLLHDAQYNAREYKKTRAWGHSMCLDAVDLALDAGVKRLGLFHHDPSRSDDQLDQQVERCRRRIARAGSKMECFAVAERMVLHL